MDYLLILAIPSYDNFVERMTETQRFQVISIDDYNTIVNEFNNAFKELNPIIYNSSSYDELEKTSNEIINLLIK